MFLDQNQHKKTHMRTLGEIKAQLELMKPILRERFQVETIGIFGSYCHGRQKKRSDVDILVTFSEPNNIDLIDLVGLQQFITRKLKTKVDLVEKDSLKAQIKDKILEETVYV
jgi:predicted nucleotidyltransferase